MRVICDKTRMIFSSKTWGEVDCRRSMKFTWDEQGKIYSMKEFLLPTTVFEDMIIIEDMTTIETMWRKTHNKCNNNKTMMTIINFLRWECCYFRTCYQVTCLSPDAKRIEHKNSTLMSWMSCVSCVSCVSFVSVIWAFYSGFFLFIMVMFRQLYIIPSEIPLFRVW